MIIGSNNGEARKYLTTKETIHKLIDLSLQSCEKEYEIKTDNEKYFVTAAIQVLFNLASFDRSKFYIPGETANVSQRRKKFALCGGLAALYYLDKNAEHSDVKKLFEALKMAEIQINDLTLTLESLKEHQSKNRAEDDLGFSE